MEAPLASDLFPTNPIEEYLMSFGSNPPPQNPYAYNQNLGHQPPESSSTKTQLTVVGCILLTMGVMTFGLGLVGLVSNLVNGDLINEPPPGMPANQQLGFQIGNIAGQVGMVLFQVLSSCGALCMILRKFYPMAITGAVVSLIPLCGPCLGLSIPFGIWGSGFAVST